MAPLAGLWVAACSSAGGDAYFGHLPTPDPSHLTLCAMGEPASFDPAYATSATDLKIVYELFDGLTTFSKAGLPLPSLATSWEVSPDVKTFTFHLRPDARWSNGRALVAEDFIYSYARTLHPLTGSPNADALRRLRHGKAFNAGTAEVVLAEEGVFKAGEAVTLTDPGEKFPGPNLRVARGETALRTAPRDDAEVLTTAPAKLELAVTDRRCPSKGEDGGGACWAFLQGPSVQGWARLDGLDAPNDAHLYKVRGLDRDVDGELPGRDLLMLPELLGVRALDPHTLVIETDGPTPYLVDLTLQRAFRPVPREAVDRWSRRWTEPTRIVTSGPFHLASHRIGDKVELVREPSFWDAAHVRLARVTFLAIENQAAGANVYYQGGCDALTANGLPMTYLPAVEGKRDFQLAPYLGIYFLMVNTRHYPNVHFRRALALALDRNALAGLLRGWGMPADHFVPGTPIAGLSPEERRRCGVKEGDDDVALLVAPDLCYRSPPGLAYDPEAARRELALAREELGAELPAQIVYRFNAGFEIHKTIAEWVQSEWRRVLGIDVALETQEWKTYLHEAEAGRFDVARMAWLGSFPDPDSEYLNIFRCDAPNNDPKYCDAEVDGLLAEADADGDGRRRLAIAHEVEARVLQAAPVIPLFVYTQNHLQKPWVRELYVNITDHQSLRETWIDAAWRAH